METITKVTAVGSSDISFLDYDVGDVHLLIFCQDIHLFMIEFNTLKRWMSGIGICINI